MRIGPDPAQVDLCVFFGHMRVAMCAGWGALRGTGVDAHAVRAHALRACVLDCADCPGSSGTHSGPVRAGFLGTCAWLCVLGGGLCVALASTRMLCFFCVPCSSGTHGGFSVGRGDGSMVGMLP